MNKPKDIQAQIEALKKGKVPAVAPKGENQKIDKPAETKVDGRRNNRGMPGVSGRKPKETNLILRGIKQHVDDHINEEVEVEVTDPKTGKKITIKQPRITRVLAKLYMIGMNGQGSADALAKWLDRALGKAPQTLRGGDEDDAPLRIDVTGFEGLLDKAYGDHG